jgi:hypothetical protein
MTVVEETSRPASRFYDYDGCKPYECHTVDDDSGYLADVDGEDHHTPPLCIDSLPRTQYHMNAGTICPATSKRLSHDLTNRNKSTETTKDEQLVERPSHHNKTSTMTNPSAQTSLNNNRAFFSKQSQATSTEASFTKDSTIKEPENLRTRKSSTSLDSLENHEVVGTPRQTGRVFSQEESWDSSSTYGSVDEDALLHVTSKVEAEAEAGTKSEPAVFPDVHPSRTSDRLVQPHSTNLPVQSLPSVIASPGYLSSETSASFPSVDRRVDPNESPQCVPWYIRDLKMSNLFVEDLPSELLSWPYFLTFIGCRIAVANNVPLKSIMGDMHIGHARNSPTLFWNSFDECLQTLPHEPDTVWTAATESFEGYTFKGKVIFESAIGKPVFKLDLLPIQAERSCLFQRMFGSDRFLYLTFQSFWDKPKRFGPDQMAQIHAQWKLWMSESHTFLGRKWRVFHVKPLGKKANLRRAEDDAPGTRVILFAMEGAGINRIMSVGEMMNEFFNFAENKNQNFCKAFARLDMGLSRTIPTLVFKPSQIKPLRDVRADLTQGAREFNDPHLDWDEQCDGRPVMNDGCARISVGAALKIWECYQRATRSDEPIPSAFQGRIGSAKGMWMISAEPHTRDPVHLETWIEVTESQRKFDPVSDDKADHQPYNCHRLTFNYLNHSFVSGSANLCTSFIPLLVDRGVQRDILADVTISRLDRERKKLIEMASNPVQLHNWISKQSSPTPAMGIVSWKAGLPSSVAEKVKLLLRSGFCPTQSPFLAKSLTSFVQQDQLWMEEKLRIPLGKSTFLKGLADLSGVLEPGEVHAKFSKPFVDEFDGRTYRSLEGEEVLVARQPAYRRSHIQKMRAVSHPELSHLVDVIVFPTRGEVPVAGKLQGGDYDGDDFWTCWEPLLVAPFRNAPAPWREPDPDKYGIEKDTRMLEQVMNPHNLSTVDGFLKEAIDFHITQLFLGKVAVLADKIAYLENRVHSERLNDLYDVRDLLVDAAKQAYRFDENGFNSLVRGRLACGNPDVPAYKQAMEAGMKPESIDKEYKGVAKDLQHNPNNIIDFLYFDVVRKHNRETQQALKDALPKEEDDDQDLQRPFLQLQGKQIAMVNRELEGLLKEFSKILQVWNGSFRDGSKLTSEKWNKVTKKCYDMFRSLMPSPENISHPQITPLLAHYLGLKHPTIWETIRSSALYTTYPKKYSFVWHMAGRELVRLKAETDANTYHVIPSVFADLKAKPSKVIRLEEEENDSAQMKETNSYNE